MNRNAHATIASFLRPIVTPLWHWKSTSLLRILAQPEVIQHRVRPSYQRIQDEVHSAIRSKSVHGEMAQVSLKVPFLKEAIDDIGYTGWLIIEGATVRGKSLVECYQENQRYLRSIFPTG